MSYLLFHYVNLGVIREKSSFVSRMAWCPNWLRAIMKTIDYPVYNLFLYKHSLNPVIGKERHIQKS